MSSQTRQGLESTTGNSGADFLEKGVPRSSTASEGDFLSSLKEAIAVAGFKRDTQNKAVAWCEKEAAASLAGVMEVFDDFATELSLKPLEKRRLEKAMRAAMERYNVEAPGLQRKPTQEPAARQTWYPAAKEAPVAPQALVPRGAAVEEAEAELEAALAGGDAATLSAAISKADAAGAGQEPLAAAKKALFRLQKERRNKSKAEKASEVPAEAPADPPGAAVDSKADPPATVCEGVLAASELEAALAEGDPTALASAIAKAHAAGVDQDQLASAKKALFKLQKEKRDKSKLERLRQEAASELAAALCGNGAEELRKAIQKAQEASLPVEEEALRRLEVLEVEEKKECIKLALEDLELAISQDDVESASLALEDASGMGASPEELKAAEEKISELRLKLDPEGEARRRRVEARKAQGTEKKWNYSGKSDNRIINDRFREHEAELERQRMLAFRARGRFRAEEEGEEGAQKNVNKLRAEVSKEFGAVPLPKLNDASSGFAWGRVPKEEAEAPRQIKLRAHIEAGAGIDLHASWWGMVVDSIDAEPGQPGLRLRDTLVEINGTTLVELSDEDCEQRFADLFGDGCMVRVEPFVQVTGILSPPGDIDKAQLQGDLERFAGDYGVELRIEDAGGNATRVHMEGSQSAVKASKPELQTLMNFYAQAT